MQSTERFKVLFAVLAAGWLAASATAQTSTTPSYTATGTMTVAEAGLTMSFRLYSDQDKQRREVEMPGLGTSAFIQRPDLGVIYMLSAGLAIEMPLPAGVMTSPSAQDFAGLGLTPSGTEQMLGETVTQYEVPIDASSMARVWITSDGILVKMEALSGQQRAASLELSSLERGPVDQGLFAAPANAMRLPAGMPFPGGGPGGFPGLGGPGGLRIPGLPGIPGIPGIGAP